LGKVDAGAISAEKAGFADRHFFALELTGDSDDGDDDIRVFRGCDRFRRRCVIHLGPEEFCMRLAIPAAV
jgi:hypothetical protein